MGQAILIFKCENYNIICTNQKEKPINISNNTNNQNKTNNYKSDSTNNVYISMSSIPEQLHKYKFLFDCKISNQINMIKTKQMIDYMTCNFDVSINERNR